MKYLILIIGVSLMSCSTIIKVNTVEYQPKMAKVVAQGDTSGLKQKLIVTCFNRYFNEERFGKQFNLDQKLTEIPFSKSMLVEIFLGESSDKKSIENVRIQENRDNLQIFYDITESGVPPYGHSAFIIVETEKSKKPIQYFENGELLGGASSKVYINR